MRINFQFGTLTKPEHKGKLAKEEALQMIRDGIPGAEVVRRLGVSQYRMYDLNKGCVIETKKYLDISPQTHEICLSNIWWIAKCSSQYFHQNRPQQS